MHSQDSTQRLPQPPSGRRARCVVPARDTPSRSHLLRIATLFRELNDAVQVYFHTDGETRGSFVCECSNETCVEAIELTPAEYGDVRAHATRFFVVPGHEMDELERVVEEYVGFLVVEKPVVP